MLRLFAFCSLLLFLATSGRAQFTVGVQVNVVQPVPPYLPQLKADIMGNRSGPLNQDISSHLSILLRYTGRSQQRIKLAGSIERISPAVMGVSLRPDFQPAQPILLGPQQPMISLTRDMLQTAFGNFTENSLVYTNCDLNSLRQNGIDFKLPEGTYRVCVTAYDYDRPGFSAPLSPPGTGCAYFTICYTASAPQLILPVSTFVNATGGFQDLTPHSNLVQFTWTPPATTCGLPMGPLTYELEIRRVFAGQTVTDAENNPYVFHQQNIPATTFLLDTLKYGQVLAPGQQYIVRVKANFIPMVGSPLEIANQGWSEVGAFTWAPVTYFPTTGLAANLPDQGKPVPPGSTIQPGGYINEPYTPVMACAAAKPVSNTAAYGGALAGLQVTIDGFAMTISGSSANTDGSYKGTGYIIWSPFGTQVKLAVSFDSLRVNTDKVVYAGEALTTTDAGFPGWSVFGGLDPVGQLTGLDDGALSAIRTRMNDGAHLLNGEHGGSALGFPLGVSTTLGGSPFTLAVMGVSFRSSCTNMSILFDLNVPDLGGWLPLAGTGVSIGTSSLLSAGSRPVLYLPKDKAYNAGGMNFDFNACPGTGGSAVDTSKGTYATWDPGSGLGNVVVNADIQFQNKAGIVAVDAADKRLTTPASIHARFNFADWNDWVATATLNNDFELAGLPGFPIHSDGLYFDHSTKQNPAGIAFPGGYVGSEDAGFEGLYIPSLSMSLPATFQNFSGAKPGAINFSGFILDNSGVTTQISATNVMDISTGNLGGWAFSIDKIGIAVVQNNFQSGMSMTGKIRLPISSDGLAYTCALNSADGKLDYQFVVQPSGSLNIPLWMAQLNLDPNSSLVISTDATGMVVKTHLNGNIGITIQRSGMPKVTLPGLTFQDMAMANRADTSAGAGAGFFFTPGKWSLGGGAPIPASLTATSGLEGAVASGPNGGDAGAEDESSQGSIAGFSLALSDFTPYFKPKSLTDMEAGVYFNVKIGIGFGDASIVSGGARLGILGDIRVPGNAAASASFDKIDCDSVGIDGEVGPVTVKGSLIFRNDDPTYGDGISGTLSANFVFAQLNAAAQFGTTAGSGGFHYWAIGGSVYVPAGIVIGPGLTVNGFGGGAFHNMTLTPPSDDEIRSHPSTNPGTIPMVPQLNTDGIQAQLLIAVLQPDICNASVTLTGTIVNGGLGQLRMDGSGYIVTNAPDNSNALVNGTMTMVYDFVQRTYDLTVGVDVRFLVATASGTLWMHGGPDGDFLYVGQPDQDKRISLELIKIGSPGDVLYVDLGATAYFDAGTELPAFPPLPDKVASLQGDKSGSDNSVTTMLHIIGTANPPNPGFMFGAEVHGNIHLSLLFLYAQVSAELGFDVALEHVTNPPGGCVQPDGSFGLNNWYGMGQFYAWFSLDVGLHVDAWFFHGDVDLVSYEAMCALQAGLPNPSWVAGTVHVQGSALGGLVSVSGDFPFSFGEQCNIPFNPLDDIQMITDIGPKDSATVFADPSAAYSVPMNDQDYPIQVPADKDHANPYTRTFRFSVAQFKLFKEEPDGSDSLTAGEGYSGGFAMTADGLGSSLYPSTMLQPHTRYKMYIQCQVRESVNNTLVTPAGSSGYQDTTYYFTTGSAPDHIVP
ncbi:MAG TPA: fibronectin type III domain-containing protein, partial [Puia sp.]|nr:fibronectin type III domain-containing protein [Puia sp.]